MKPKNFYTLNREPLTIPGILLRIGAATGAIIVLVGLAKFILS